MPKIRLNENEEVVRTIREGLAAKGGYCPCRVEIKEEYKCMCQEFRDQIADPNFEGYCHCMLYYKERDAKSSVEKGDLIRGFRVTNIRYVDELKGFFVEMVHEKTGAQLVWVENGAENKLFAVGFKTVPENSTGVFHILEHSVLGGSDKYPVKEPFVDLLKYSMNTFLNAITFDDKTVYPVSSRNKQDFLNLTEVYLDAVYAPRVLTFPNIFYQEGWHIAQEDGSFSFNGVVFNEMKGAMSSADSVVAQDLQKALLHDTNYAYNSGGDPEHITDLTYEEFCETYRRYYSPSNSRIFLDGDIPLDETLAMIDGYLSGLERTPSIAELPTEAPAPLKLETRFPLAEDEDIADRTRVALAKVIGSWKDMEKITALGILSDVIAGTNESPLKKAIIASGLAQEFSIESDMPIALPYVSVYFTNVKDGEEENVVSLMRQTAAKLADEGLDKRDLYAAINHYEYTTKDLREPQAIMRCIMSFNSWLYGGDPLMYLDHSGLFDSLRSMVENGGFEALLREFFADEDNTAVVVARPSKEMTADLQKAEEERVRKATADWTDADKAENLRLNEDLLKWQSTPDTPEQTATIPVLDLSEIDRIPSYVDTRESEADGVTVLSHDLNTNGIVHETLYFKLTELDADALTKFSSCTGMFTNLPTDEYSVVELQREMKNTFGRFSVSVETRGLGKDLSRCVPFLTVRFSCLKDLAQQAEKLAVHIVTRTDFSDETAVRNLVNQRNEALKQYPVTRGNTLATTVALASDNPVYAAAELISGLSQIRWIKNFAENWEENSAAFSALVKDVLEKTVCRARLTVSVTSDSRHDPSAAVALLPEGTACPEYAEYVTALPARSAIVIPAPVGYSSQGFTAGCYDGSIRAASQMISFAFLWNEVRVKGGAYGTRFGVRRNGTITTYSYRDPSPEKSVEINKSIGAFLREFLTSGQKIDGFVISAVAAMDPLMSPAEIGQSADSDWYTGFTKEDAIEERRQLLETSKEDILRAADLTDRFAAQAPYCIVAGENLITDKESVELLKI